MPHCDFVGDESVFRSNRSSHGEWLEEGPHEKRRIKQYRTLLLCLLPLVIISAFLVLMEIEYTGTTVQQSKTPQSLTANTSRFTVTPDDDFDADADNGNEEEILSSRNSPPYNDADTTNSSSNVNDASTQPSDEPSAVPSDQPSSSPSKAPSTQPSDEPSAVPIIPDLHAQYKLLQINENSALAEDIINITHVQSESKIILHLKKNETRYCQQPQLIGRLSGPALSIVSWKQPPTTRLFENSTRYDMLVGTYNAPVPDAKPHCVVDPLRHRLTKDETSISVNANIDNSSAIGYWYNKATLVDKYDPLYTRHQPQDCPRKKAEAPPNSPAHCFAAMNLSGFEPYEFKFSTGQTSSLQNVVKGKEGKVCIIGASHSHHLAQLLKDTVASSLDTNLTVTVDPPDNYLRYVKSDFTTNEIQKRIDLNCTKVVLGTGQWDAGWPNGHPTSFHDYENQLGNALERMNTMFRQANIDFYVRETHYNPIGYAIGSCPAIDWRNPPLIDMYRQISKRVCAKHNIPLIETNDIIGIMWDRAADWCHYSDISRDMELIYILSQIFG